MSRAASALMILLIVASCGDQSPRAPRNLDDACKILDENSGFERAFKAANRKWGVPVAGMMAIMYQESKFIADIRPPGRVSSAYGYSQALDGTWREYQRQHAGSRARRDNIKDATDFMGWYMDKSRKGLGLRMTDTYNHYLAYHEGRTGYSRGTYRAKSWLIDVTRKVADRAVMYDVQLRACGKI